MKRAHIQFYLIILLSNSANALVRAVPCSCSLAGKWHENHGAYMYVVCESEYEITPICRVNEWQNY